MHNRINSFEIILLQLAYAYLGCKINLEYKYSDVWEFLCGIIVTTILMNILDYTFYKIAYSITKTFSIICDYDSSDRKLIHWRIRVLLYIIVYIISITPLCSIILTPIIQYLTKESMQWFNGRITDFSNALKDSITRVTKQ